MFFIFSNRFQRIDFLVCQYQYFVNNIVIMAGNQVLTGPMTVVGMVNGMIGGLILILPLLALQAGYILTLIVILLTGLFSYYSCHLCVLHMGDQPDLDYAILRHFNGNRAIKIFYDLCVWSNLILIDMLYLSLIVQQWSGLTAPDPYSIINPLVNAAALFLLVFVLKYFQFGASVMAYGIISIITYLLFLIWVIITSNKGNQQQIYKPFGTGAANLAAAMGQAFSIQSFFIPVLKKNPNPSRYTFYTMIAYILGACAYYYIAYMGSFGILHRYPSENPQTIENYFAAGVWEVKIIQGIYLVHLYSVFPQFLLISKKRFFGVFQLSETVGRTVNIAELVYIVIFIAICLIVAIFQVNINDIISINGAVIGFLFIYFMPALLHVKCLYFSHGKRFYVIPIQPINQISENNDAEVKAQQITITNKQSKRNTQIQIGNQANEIQQFNNKKQKQASLKEPLIHSQYQQNKIDIKLHVNRGNQDKNQISIYERQNASIREQNDLREQQQRDRITQTATVPRRGDSTKKIVLSDKQIQNSYFYCSCERESYTKLESILDLAAMTIMVLLGAFILVNGLLSVING